jgi:hypothetical protein
VTSNPPGALVYADDRLLGVTPLLIPPHSFPTRMKGLVYQADGTLKIEKEGCLPYQQVVDDAFLNQAIQVKLECGSEDLSDKAAVVTRDDAGETFRSDSGTIDPLERRLRRLDRLHDKGLVTDQEHREIRRRILREL